VTYQSIVEMAGSQSLQARITAAAASEGREDPLPWMQSHIWEVVSTDTGWSDAWDYARDAATLDNNPDTGARPGVINDQMILTVVQTVLAEDVEP
jgi:hypothetical protein